MTTRSTSLARLSASAVTFGTVGLGLLGFALPSPASACGGFFCSSQPIDQSGENIVFSVERDGSIEAHVQILYQGPSEEFAWILPTPSAPTISVGTDTLFRQLDQATRPQFQMSYEQTGTCRDEPSCPWDYESDYGYGPPRAGGFADGGAAVDAASRVDVVFRGNVGPYDAAVLSAGLSVGMEAIDRTPEAAVDEMFDTNVAGVLRVVRAVVPGMRARGRGHLVFLGSVAGREAYAGGAVYGATKAAVALLAEGARRDLHGTGLRVTNVAPGMVETDFARVRFGGDEARAAAVYADTEPLTPEDVADAVVYALTRPARVNVSEVFLMPTAQASATLVHRTPRG